MTKKHKAGRIEMQIAPLMNPFCLPLARARISPRCATCAPRDAHPPAQPALFRPAPQRKSFCFLETQAPHLNSPKYAANFG